MSATEHWPDEPAMERAWEALAGLPARVDGRLIPRPNPEGNACLGCGTTRSARWKRVDRFKGVRQYVCLECRGGG